MSKKMKQTAALVTSPAYTYGYEDYNNYNKISSKHQVLLQEYHDLFKDTDNTRNKLDNAKHRKLVLSAEVRFLRKKHQYLLKTRSLNRPQEQRITIENQSKHSRKESALLKREATAQFKLPPLPDLKHKGRVYAGKEGAMKNMAPLPPLDLNRKVTSRSGKESAASGLTAHQAWDSNYRKRINSVKEAGIPNIETATNMIHNEKKYQGGNGNGFGTRMPVFDLNQDTSFSGKETALPTRAPIFDLNEISMEEEEVQNNYELMTKFEEPKKGGLMKAGNEDQTTDMKLSLCRNAGEGSSRMGKRKISWQDPVALRV